MEGKNEFVGALKLNSNSPNLENAQVSIKKQQNFGEYDYNNMGQRQRVCLTENYKMEI